MRRDADLPRFFAETIPQVGQSIALNDDESNHAARVLRLGAGDAVILFDGRGTVAAGAIEPPRRPADRRKSRPVEARIESREVPAPPDSSLTLVMAACKGPRLELVVEKCAELGVRRLLLAEFTRSVVRPGEAHLDKLRRRELEACKQCERLWRMEIGAAGAIESAALAAPLLVAHPDPGAPLLGRWLQGNPATAAISVVIGPEGGITEDELRSLRSRGAVVVRLADTILRVETAAIAAAACFAAAHG